MKIRGLKTFKNLLAIQWGYLPLYFVHRFTDLFPNDEVFKSIRSFILKGLGLRIRTSSKFGRGIFVQDYGKFSVGNKSVVNNQVYFDSSHGVIIGNGCDIGFKSCFITSTHQLESDFLSDRPLDKSRCGKIVIEDFVWIGANATILPGVTVKRGAVVGACSLVTRDVEENSVVAGIPAKKVKSIHQAGNVWGKDVKTPALHPVSNS
jgi:acetyltransferase-like isoleucine patch superfamily enzyme